MSCWPQTHRNMIVGDWPSLLTPGMMCRMNMMNRIGHSRLDLHLHSGVQVSDVDVLRLAFDDPVCTLAAVCSMSSVCPLASTLGDGGPVLEHSLVVVPLLLCHLLRLGGQR